jgi:hypothetical protein
VLIGGGLLIAGLAVFGVWRVLFAGPSIPPGVIAVSGRIEGDDSAVGAKTSGRIREILPESLRAGGRDRPGPGWSGGAGLPGLGAQEADRGGRDPDRSQGLVLEVHQGEILGLIGPDGAGETSMFQILAGVMEATAGTASTDQLALDSSAGAAFVTWPMGRWSPSEAGVRGGRW